ncbi:MAG TPA: DUF4140 domain-containing protein, partial [Bacteroidales bacterium]|nr:DUF4140 domain-containing protein [Bacteroidales bacterium]
MKSIVLAAIILPLTLTLSYGAAEKEIKGEITHVTLYPDRAQVTSEAAVSLQPGINVLVMKGLSPYIIRSTIQVGGEGSFTIMGISHSNNFLEITGDSPEVKEIKARIE